METPICFLPNRLKDIFGLSDELTAKIDSIINNESARWVILFVAVLLSYAYIFYTAYNYKSNPDNISEKSETALFLNPSLGGYNKVRGDPNSPPLFKWDTSEIILVSAVSIITLFLFWYIINKSEPDTPLYVKIIQFIFTWTHIVILLFFIPVNNFHRRILYNARSTLAQICNDPLKELWLAFLFIVLLPLPGSSSHTERISWMALKLGIFYIIQNLLLGPPNYKIESVIKNNSLPDSDTKTQLLGYGILFIIIILLVVKDRCKRI